jgi:hypothetical protein
MQAQHTTTIPDAAGTPHEYITTAFPTSKGYDLLLEIADISSGPVGAAISTFIAMAGAEGDTVEIPDLTQAVQSIPRVLAAKGGSAFLLRLLRNTNRENEKGEMLPLREKVNFDVAYASNYLELFRAVAWVVEVNFAPFSADGSPSWKGPWKQLEPYIPLKKIETPTTKPSGK